MPRNLVLAGDIGGTKTSLALFSINDDKLRMETEHNFPSKKYSGLVPILDEFSVRNNKSIDAACFGVAGPVVDGHVKTTNLPWVIDSQVLRQALRVDTVYLLNDLEAAAYGVFTLDNEEFYTLNEGTMHSTGNKALIAAGTGLGQAILYDDGRHFHALPSEGGHADFAPRTELEIDLLRYLLARFGHV